MYDSPRLGAALALALLAGACAAEGTGEGQHGSEAQAITQELLLPFPPGHTWTICQSYVGFSHKSNRPFDIGWTQSSCNAGNNDTGGRPIVASGAGEVTHMPNAAAGGDFMCISLTGGGAIALGHVKPQAGIALGTEVAAGDQVATVRTSTDPNAQNAGIAHLHFEAWSGNSCYTGTAQAFTGSYRMQCAPDLPYSAEYGHYNGTPLTACQPKAVEHDVNGDGRADLVSVRDDGDAWVWPGMVDGSFGAHVASFAGTLNAANVDGTGHYIVGVADVTGDGRSDLVSVNKDGHAYVWPGKSTGKFGVYVGSFDGFDLANIDGTGHQVIGVADVTGDGKADLVDVDDEGTAWVHPGAASGAFGSGVASFEGTYDLANHDGTGHYAVGVADVNGDGHADLVSVHDSGNAYVYPGKASGAFGGGIESFNGTMNHALWDGTGHYVIDVADVTGDGRADLVTAQSNGNVYVYAGKSTGAFSSYVKSFAGTMDFANLDGTGHYLVGVADIDGDGHGDLVGMGDDGRTIVWRGKLDGHFDGAVTSFGGTMDFANLDGSGHFIVAPSGPDGDHATASVTPVPAASGAGAGQAKETSSSASGGHAEGLPEADGTDDADAVEGGCSCRAAGSSSTAPEALILAALAAAARLVGSRFLLSRRARA